MSLPPSILRSVAPSISIFSLVMILIMAPRSAFSLVVIELFYELGQVSGQYEFIDVRQMALVILRRGG